MRRRPHTMADVNKSKFSPAETREVEERFGATPEKMHSPHSGKLKFKSVAVSKIILPARSDLHLSSKPPLVSKKRNQSIFKNAYYHKRFSARRRRRSQVIPKMKALVDDFLTNKFSAAGVSYVVRTQSKWRKIVWFTAIILSLCFMAYMTTNVVLEYTKYPTMLIRDDKIFLKLVFPAVTVCSLSPMKDISGESFSSSTDRLNKLMTLLDKFKTIGSNTDLRDKCHANLLCQWSWFNETCQCVKNPCITEYCLPENKSHCACIFSFCNRRKGEFESCSYDEDSSRCLCADRVMPVNNSLEQLNPTRNLSGWIESLDDPAREILNILRDSKTNDLVDVRTELVPSMRELFEFGIDFDDLIISCSFNGRACYRENFTVLYHPSFGKCFMFNYLGNKPSNEKPVESKTYGSSSGLRMLLNVLNTRLASFLNPELGARVVVHDPYELPFVIEYGVNVRPHDMTAFEVRKSVVERLKAPYGDCTDGGEHLRFKWKEDQSYSILGCQKTCNHISYLYVCNCTRRRFLTGTTFPSELNYEICRMNNPRQRKCVQDVMKLHTSFFAKEKRNWCDCKPRCRETWFSTTVSSSRLNENFYRYVKNIRTLHLENGTPTVTVSAERETMMVGLKVYFSTFQVNTDKETPSYSWETLIANIGGNLGFFMGLTLLTFMEVIEFLWDILMAATGRCKPHQTGPKLNGLSRF